MIGIIDIGLGNLSSIKNSVETLFFDAQIIKSSKLIKDCTHLILPGVGSFKFGMHQINTFGWKSPIIDFVKSGKPVLGICLGCNFYSATETNLSRKGIKSYSRKSKTCPKRKF